MNWINLFGLIIVILILLPNLIYFYRNRSIENSYKNKLMNILEQIGRYGSMFLLVVNIGFNEFAFQSGEEFTLCLIITSILIVLYWILWFIYFKRTSLLTSMMLAIIPSILFISQGIFLRYLLLIITSILFSIAHCYITYQNSTNHST